MQRIELRIISTIALLGILMSTSATDVIAQRSFSWTGAVSSDWSDPCNWQPKDMCQEGEPYPGEKSDLDIVDIPNRLPDTSVDRVLISGEITVGGLTLSSRNVTLGDSRPGPVINVLGQFSWTQGRIEMRVKLGPLSVGVIDGADLGENAPKHLWYNTFENSGYLTWLDGSLTISYAGQIRNKGTFHIATSQNIQGTRCCIEENRVTNIGTMVIGPSVLDPLQPVVAPTMDAVYFTDDGGTIRSGAGSSLRLTSGVYLLQNTRTEGAGRLVLGSGEGRLSGTLDLRDDSVLEIQKNVSSLVGVAKLGGHGFFDWTGGALSGSFEMLEHLRVRILGPDLKSLSRLSQDDPSQRGRLALKGATTWSGSGEVRLASAAQIVNSGTLIALSDAALTSTSCCVTRNEFINHGTIEKRESSGTTRFAGVFFDQNGAVDVRSGEIIFEIGHVMIKDESRFSGEGRARFDNNVQVFLDGTAEVREEATVEISGSATMTASGAFSGDGTVVWSGGYVEGDLEIGERTAFRIEGTATKELRVGGGSESRILARGYAFLDGSTMTLRGKSTFANRGMFTISGDAHVRGASCCTNPSAFENQGALIVPVGADVVVSNMYLRNSGTISLYESSLNADSPLGFQQSDGQLLVDGGRFESKSGFIFTGGKVIGNGVLKGSVINYARFAPGDIHGVLVIDGNYDQAPSGALEIEIGGREPGSSHDRLRVTGSTTLDGLLAIYRAADFEPAENDAFMILQYPSRQGEFSRVTGLSFTPERSLALGYDRSHGDMHGLVLNAAAPTGRGALYVSQGSHVHSPQGHTFDLDPNRLTVEAWIKHSEQSEPDAVLISKGATGANPSFELSLVGMGEDVRVRFMVAADEYSVVSSMGAAAGVWTHIAGVYDGAHIRIYIDGELAGSMAYSGGMPLTADPLRLGAAGDGSRGFGGLIDEVRIWKNERSAAAITHTMYRTLAGDENGLAAYYPFSAGMADGAGGPHLVPVYGARVINNSVFPVPPRLFAKQRNRSDVELTWQTRGTDPDAPMRIFRSVGAERQREFVAHVDRGTRSFVDTGLEPDVHYIYEVLTVDGFVSGDFSSAESGVPSARTAGTSLVLSGRGDMAVVSDRPIFDRNGHVTVEAWVEHSGTSDPDAIILTRQHPTQESQTSYELSFVGSGENVPVRFMLDGPTRSVTSTVNVQAGRFTHVAGVYDGSSLKIYVDGQEAGSAEVSGIPANGAGPLRFGANAYGDRGYRGKIDEVRIWHEARSAEQLSVDHRSGWGDATNLAAYFRFDEQSGSIARSSAGRPMTAHLLGGARFEAGGPVPIDRSPELPERIALEGNYPNPFNPQTTIRFSLPAPEAVHLTVFNTLGQLVATLLNGESRPAGIQEVRFDASNLPSGMYLYRLHAGGTTVTGRMTLVK
jgi:hypothetical protein